AIRRLFGAELPAKRTLEGRNPGVDEILGKLAGYLRPIFLDRHRDHKAIFRRFFRILILAVFVVLLGAPAYAQERRGDRPARNAGKIREARRKSRDKQGDSPRTRDVAGRRVRTKNKSSAERAQAVYPTPKAARAAGKRRDGDRPGRPVAPIMGSRPRDNQRAWSDGIYGRRVHVRSATGRA